VIAAKRVVSEKDFAWAFGIQVEGLTKSFGSQRIWEDVTFDIPQGEVSVLLGPSGTGKSVFLKSLIGLLRPERGKIIVARSSS
jgi:phospholipid/cholesterol/gamma-HCH transport system ATP-binding protein